ncbi:uncharacterized protein LOC130684213 [Manis pentadactyla]|uniref:uncharacterized protein LOC130684213 n=1 Tax=Manis pentadactyla TaxID=143292 RepID=UPI00255CBC77|nr:uncharacterized protein LOC130684213 [Manis pentadactyla]
MVSANHWPAGRQPPSAKVDWEVRPLAGTEQETSQGRGTETPALRTREPASQPVCNWQVCSLPDTTGQTRPGARPRRSSSHPWNTSLAKPSASVLGATCPGTVWQQLHEGEALGAMPVQQDTGLSGCSLLQPCIGRAMRQGLSEGTHSVEMVSKHPEAQSSRCPENGAESSPPVHWGELASAGHPPPCPAVRYGLLCADPPHGA